MAFPKPKHPPGLALHRGREVSRDPLWIRGEGREDLQVRAGSGQPPVSPQQQPRRPPPPCLQLPQPAVPLQVHLRREELKLIPRPTATNEKETKKQDAGE